MGIIESLLSRKRFIERKGKLKQQMSAFQMELDDSKRAYRWVSYSHCGLGRGLKKCKEELKQQMSALQGELHDSKRAYMWVS